MTDNAILSAKIAGSGYDDFYPYELILEEGFSRIYRAELTVLTKTLHAQKNLKDLLDQNISLRISQRITGGLVVRSRYLHGIITGAANCGIVNRGEGANGYRCVITIESELARLRHTCLNYPYYRKTPPGIIGEILAKYNIQGNFSSDYVDCSNFSGNLMFDQVNISDLDFIRRLMDIYGLSWTFVHRQVKGGLGTAELHFTEGNRFPLPFYEYSDSLKPSGIEKFDFINYDDKQNLWKMEGWRMEDSIGVDGLEVNAPYPEANYGSSEWRWGSIGRDKRYHSYQSLFHGYERRTETSEIDADIKRIIEARRVSFTLEKERWKGAAENILLMPGIIFELGHFYGSKDSGSITALITGTRLHVRALWPRDIGAPPRDAETGELARTELSAVDWGKDSGKRFCGNNH